MCRTRQNYFVCMCFCVFSFVVCVCVCLLVGLSRVYTVGLCLDFIFLLLLAHGQLSVLCSLTVQLSVNR